MFTNGDEASGEPAFFSFGLLEQLVLLFISTPFQKHKSEVGFRFFFAFLLTFSRSTVLETRQRERRL